MAINPNDAIKAFTQASRLGGAGMEAPKSPSDSSFAELVGKVAEDAMQSGKTAEAMTAKAVVGEADLVEVVTAVNSAEMALQTVVTVRDRVISAYQEILRMPI